ncbi:MAG: tRNA pseudouridine synthase A, partial [Campylobacterota bacterium]|nr:tRNA pseudouridine synthase A [Campylobacterota bacterium]
MRTAITLAYNGTSFLGSQIQKETQNTIFGQFEKVLSQLGINFRVVASGRTDKGVHATGQVCHIDLPPFWSDLKKLKRVLNGMLPRTIQVKEIQRVSDDFHARYGAKRRVYRYIIKKSDSNPFEKDFITFNKNIDFETVKQNIKLFIGEHNFKNFM